jgi:hypothetical protein
MDIDALAKDFARFKPMLEDMLKNWKEWKADQEADLATADMATAPAPVITDELHAEIHAPLHDSEEQIAAKRAQAIDNGAAAESQPPAGDDDGPALDDDGPTDADIMLARFVELGPDQVRTLLTNGSLPAAWTSPATLWLAEQDKRDLLPTGNDAGQGSDAPAPGQNQGNGEPDGSATGEPTAEAGEALPEPSLTEQAPAEGLDRIDEVAGEPGQVNPVDADGRVVEEVVATDQGSTAKAV